MNLLKVLLVVYAFTPAGGAGPLRAASLARYFPPQEIQPGVLTSRSPSSVGSGYSLRRAIPSEVTIHPGSAKIAQYKRKPIAAARHESNDASAIEAR